MTTGPNQSAAGRHAARTPDVDDLPLNPYESLRVGQGMLLGVEDFRVLTGYPRGKQLLHAAWAHGSGVVWGFHGEVTGTGRDAMLTLQPGLAVDGHGRELPLDVAHCQNLQKWLDTHPDVPREEREGRIRVTAAVVASARQQLERPVPAQADPNDVSRWVTDSSRIVEGTYVELLPVAAWSSQAAPYRRARILLGLDEAGDDDQAGADAVEARAEIEKEPPGRRPAALLEALRRLCVLDANELTPPPEAGGSSRGLFRVPDGGASVLLGHAVLVCTDRSGSVLESASFDPQVRTTVLPTGLLQDLVCGLAPAFLGEQTRQDAGGPRVRRDSIRWEDDRVLTFRLTRPAARGSQRGSVRLASLGESGWSVEDVENVGLDESEHRVTVRLHNRPKHPLVRLVVSGRGLTPLVGRNSVPLAGMDDGPPGSPVEGHDAVHTLGRWES